MWHCAAGCRTTFKIARAQARGAPAPNSISDGQLFIEHAVDRLDNRRVHLQALTQAVGGERCAHALGHLMHGGNRCFDAFALAEGLAHGAIAREAAGAGHHQVAHTGKPQHGEHMAALGHAQAGHFCQAAGDHGGAGIFSHV